MNAQDSVISAKSEQRTLADLDAESKEIIIAAQRRLIRKRIRLGVGIDRRSVENLRAFEMELVTGEASATL